MKVKLDHVDPDIQEITYYRVSELCKAGCDIFSLGDKIVKPEDFPFYKPIERPSMVPRIHIEVNYCGRCGEKTEVV